jgi:hypothetical protein
MPFSSLIAFFDPFGTVPGSSLNWSQHALLEKRGGRSTTQVAWPSGPTIDTDRICRALESVGQNVAEVVDAIDWLVSDLNLRLDAQTELLNQQADLLAEIAQTLRSPARTRAAERVRDATELLRHHRNERALTVAEQAIDDDPNSDTAFILAGWASLGIGNLQRARGYFREAAQATASTRDAETRHMNAVYLAARLTFALEGPEAALNELDAAEPFVDPTMQKEHPRFTKEQLCLSLLSPNNAGAIKFDRTVYYTANNNLDAALETFREIAEGHDIRFCLMALTDPVLATNEAVVNAARETLRVHQTLINEIQERLPASELRWWTLWTEIQKHEIRNTDTVAALPRFGELFTPSSAKRKTLEETWPWPPSRRWLEHFSAKLREFDNFEAKMRPLIERERMREAALDTHIQELLRPRKVRLVHRTRLEAVVGRHHSLTMGGYTFRRITVDESGKVTVTEQEATNDLMNKFEAASKKS